MLISFPKPVVTVVNGPAVGLGVALLPLCDIIYASDKASFCTPYVRLAQTPEGCSSYTFPHVMGMAMVCTGHFFCQFQKEQNFVITVKLGLYNSVV